MLVIGGQDLTLKMDFVEQVRPFSAMPIDTRIQVILGGYGALGIVPSVVPPPIVETPIPTERIPNQVGTDYTYIRSLAAMVGHRFTLDPGPAPGSSVAYWGPEPRGDANLLLIACSAGTSLAMLDTFYAKRLSAEAHRDVLARSIGQLLERPSES
jgi:hypothetical protein